MAKRSYDEYAEMSAAVEAGEYTVSGPVEMGAPSSKVPARRRVLKSPAPRIRGTTDRACAPIMVAAVKLVYHKVMTPSVVYPQ